MAVAEIWVLLKCFNERLLAEDVHAHIDESQFRIGQQRTRRHGLLFEFDGPAVWIRFDNAKRSRQFDRILSGGHRQVRATRVVTMEQFAVIHVIDLICGNNQDVLRAALLDPVNILEHRVCCAPVSLTAAWRQTDDMLATIPPKLITKLRPTVSHVRMQALMLVLSEHINVPKSRIQHIRERKVDDAEYAAKRHHWFGLIRRERIKAFALTSCEDERQCLAFKVSR